jgi:microcystin degradation protein MlrC
VELVLTAGRRAFTTVERFREAGIDPIERRVVVVKQGYLFPELRAIAAGAIMALSPGFTDLRLEGLPYRRIRRPVYPLDGDFPWHPAGPGTD